MSKKEQNIKHVGIIADGSRRWAIERNLSVVDGYKKTLEQIFVIPKYFFEEGVEVVSVSLFSQINWERDHAEINSLMKLLHAFLKDEAEKIKQKNWRVLISGEIKELPGDIEEECHNLMNATKMNTEGSLNLCINYDGHQEILNAIRKMIVNKTALEQIHEGLLRKYLYQGGLSDLDILIRTGGENNTLGFQLWQSTKSKIFFLKKYWPDFEKIDAQEIIKNYLEMKKEEL